MNKKIKCTKDASRIYRGKAANIIIEDNGQQMYSIERFYSMPTPSKSFATFRHNFDAWVSEIKHDLDYVNQFVSNKTKDAQIFHNSNGTDYEIIEMKNGNALLHSLDKNAYQPWICAWSLGKSSWGQGHYFREEADARKYWKKNYAKDSLKTYRINGQYVKGKNLQDAMKKIKDESIKVDAYLENEDEDIKYIEKKYHLKVKYNPRQQYDNMILTGNKKDIINYLTSDLYGMEKDDVKEFYPELFK